jgi:3-hydroxyacyl-[acyl-carrier-protein] dehydratase
LDFAWHTLSQPLDNENGSFGAEAYAPTGSPWFSGHFPGEPVLPGIAILSMVKDTLLASGARQGRKFRISDIRRVRFKLPVKPDQVVQILLSAAGRAEDLAYTFKVELDGAVACTGIIQARLVPE